MGFWKSCVIQKSCQVTPLRLVTRDFCITCDFQNPILTFRTHSIYTCQKLVKSLVFDIIIDHPHFMIQITSMDYLNLESKQRSYTTTPPGFEVKLKNLLQMPTHPESVRYSLPEPWLGFRFRGS